MAAFTHTPLGALWQRGQPASRSHSPVQAGGSKERVDAALERFNRLVLEHQDAAYNLACYLTGNPDLADDVVQKAFLSAYLHFQDFKGDSFRSWLLKIVKNACYDEFRNARRHPCFRIDALTGDDEESRDIKLELLDTRSTVLPEQALEQKEQQASIYRALDRLPRHWRTAVVLIDIEGLDYVEAARVTGCPLGTIKSRLARGRKMLGVLVER